MFSVRDTNGAEFKINLLRRDIPSFYHYYSLRDLYLMYYALEKAFVRPARKTHDMSNFASGVAKLREIKKEIYRRLKRGDTDLTPMQKWKLRRMVQTPRIV